MYYYKHLLLIRCLSLIKIVALKVMINWLKNSWSWKLKKHQKAKNCLSYENYLSQENRKTKKELNLKHCQKWELT